VRPNPGDLVGNKYRIARLIGDGGMGAVFEARHEVLGAPVALKFLHTELAKRPGLASRFLQEAKVSASIQSPHVTRVTDVDTTADGSPYMVMELLTGEALQQLLDRRRKLTVEQAIDFALQIASGLEAAHALGVVHRDLKPDNVFITPSPGGPLLKLLDFGIAKLRESSEYKKGLTRPGAIMGTPEYMSPEQLYAADRVDLRADLYSLGAILYEMLSGERPANGDDAQQIIGQVIAGKVKPIRELEPALPEGLAQAVHRALEPDKTRRFASAAEMRQALTPFAGQLSYAGRLAAALMPSGSPGEARRPLTSPSDKPAEPPRSAVPAPTIDAPFEVAPASVAPTAALAQDRPIAAELRRPAFGKGSTEQAPQAALPSRPAEVEAVAARYASVPAAPSPIYSIQPAPQRSTSGRALAAIVALLLGILLTAVGIAVVLMLRKKPESEALQPSSPPTTTLSPQGAPPELPPTPDPTVPAAKPSPRPNPAPGKPRGDGGTKQDAGSAKSDAGPPQTSPHPFPIPLPSGFPPLPSGFPPFPFPFPKPPPASSSAP
jgi:eukaryotic-like serine/threonine-protein kinase